MYNERESYGRDGKRLQRAEAVSGIDPKIHVLDLYARLAADRAVDARIALRHSNSADELLAQSAQALEDAAGTLTLARGMCLDDREAFARVLREQAAALVVLAAQFEQAADLARHEQSGGPR
jgi:hypothetical protein